MASSEKSLQEILDNQANTKFGLKKMIGYGCIALIIISISAYFWPNETNEKYRYATEKIAMGALTVTVWTNSCRIVSGSGSVHDS